MWRKSGIREKTGAPQQEIVWQRSGPEGRVEDGGQRGDLASAAGVKVRKGRAAWL